MAILRSVDGKFYEIPDEELGQFEVPAEKVNELMAAMGGGESEGPPPGEGDVEPYHHRWYRRRRYYWRNCWRNYWRNCY